MAVKIRLTRRGRKNAPVYNIVAADTRVSRDGKFIKKLGLYNPCSNPSIVEINREDILLYLLNGAQTTSTARRLLSDAGIMIKKHLQVGVMKGKISQQEADKKFEEWRKDKERRVGKPLPGFSNIKLEDDKVGKGKEIEEVSSDKSSKISTKTAKIKTPTTPGVEKGEVKGTENVAVDTIGKGSKEEDKKGVHGGEIIQNKKSNVDKEIKSSKSNIAEPKEGKEPKKG